MYSFHLQYDIIDIMRDDVTHGRVCERVCVSTFLLYRACKFRYIRDGIIFGYLEITEHICTVQCIRIE